MAHKKQKPGNKHSLAKYKKGGDKLHVSTYTISYEPMEDNSENLPKPVKDRLQILHDMLRSNPRQAIKELLVLKVNYPDVPRLYNFLSAAYGIIGNHKATEELIIENYQKNPDYLFAKINYAQICLENGDAEKVSDIFDGKFDLKMLYPNRNCFHVTEYAGFTGVMCAYFAAIGKQDTAQLLYKSLLEVAPDSEMTRFALSFMYPSLLNKLRKMIKR